MDKKENYNEMEAFQEMARKAQELEKKLAEATNKLQGLEERLADTEGQKEEAERKLTEARARLNPEKAPSPKSLHASRFDFHSAMKRDELSFNELLRNHMESQRPGSWEHPYSKEYIRQMKEVYKHYHRLPQQYQKQFAAEFGQSHAGQHLSGAAYVAGITPLLAGLENYLTEV